MKELQFEPQVSRPMPKKESKLWPIIQGVLVIATLIILCAIAENI